VAVTPGVRIFVRLKLRILANGFRGRPSRIILFVLGILGAIYLSGIGFVVFAVSAAAEDPEARLMVASFAGALLVLGAVLLPLIWFGIDDTLDPARFAAITRRVRRMPRDHRDLALLGKMDPCPQAALRLRQLRDETRLQDRRAARQEQGASHPSHGGFGMKLLREERRSVVEAVKRLDLRSAHLLQGGDVRPHPIEQRLPRTLRRVLLPPVEIPCEHTPHDPSPCRCQVIRTACELRRQLLTTS
jgi:hypothetical protein